MEQLGGGKTLYPELAEKYDIVGFVDNDQRKWGKRLCGAEIYDPHVLVDGLAYDVLIITSTTGVGPIKTQCIGLGIPEERIITSYMDSTVDSRKTFLEHFALQIGDEDPGAECAEAGVFEGEFAKWINQYFPTRKLHLFDTFEGFDARDIKEEDRQSIGKVGDYYNTSVEKVMAKMPYPDNCVVHKGYFPETAQGIESKFCFVNLDLDLYLPTYSGLKFFQTRMSPHGVILVHDYFYYGYKGVKKAVDEFIRENPGKVRGVPIGDGLSILLLLQ